MTKSKWISWSLQDHSGIKRKPFPVTSTLPLDLSSTGEDIKPSEEEPEKNGKIQREEIEDAAGTLEVSVAE